MAARANLKEAAIAQATLEGMQRARAAGALVSLDLNLRPALWPADTDPLPTLWQALALDGNTTAQFELAKCSNARNHAQL